MLIIGLTGGIASGKSTVARMLEKKGAFLLDADHIAKEVVRPGEAAWHEIVEWLGASITGPGGALDRRRLSELIFADPGARRRLEAIVHPRVFETLARETAKIRRRSPSAVLIYDVPLLIESKMDELVDLVLLVYVPPEVQLKRLQKRDNLSAAEALSRVRAQMSLEEKRACADYIIDNRGSRGKTLRQVNCFWAGLQSRPGAAE